MRRSLTLSARSITVTVEQDQQGYERGLLDFAKLIQRYVRLFASSDARSALQYIYLVCLNADAPAPAGTEQTRKCHDMIRQLVIETRQYFDLLGDVRSDGTKIVSCQVERSVLVLHTSDTPPRLH